MVKAENDYLANAILRNVYQTNHSLLSERKPKDDQSNVLGSKVVKNEQGIKAIEFGKESSHLLTPTVAADFTKQLGDLLITY